MQMIKNGRIIEDEEWKQQSVYNLLNNTMINKMFEKFLDENKADYKL